MSAENVLLLGVNTDTKSAIDLENSGVRPKAADILRFIAGEKPAIAASFVNKDLTPIAFGANDTFECNLDIDFIHDLYAGTADAAYSGAVTSIVGNFTDDVTAIRDTGNITLRDSTNPDDRESVAYTAVVVTGTGPYVATFTVSKTLVNSYASGDYLAIQDRMMAQATNDDFNTGVWTEEDKTAGKLSFLMDCRDLRFVEKLVAAQVGTAGGSWETKVYMEIKRYPEGSLIPKVLFQDQVYARQTVADLESVTIPNNENWTAADARYLPVYANVDELGAGIDDADLFNILDTSTGLVKKVLASRIKTFIAGDFVEGAGNLTTQYALPFSDGAGGLSQSSSIFTNVSGYLGVGVAPYTNAVFSIPPTPSAITVNEITDFVGQFVLANNGPVANGDRIPFVFNLGSDIGNNISAAIVGEREAINWNTALSFWVNGITSGPEGTDAIQEALHINSSCAVLIGTRTQSALLEKLGVAGPALIGSGAVEGTTDQLFISGFRTGDALRTLSIGISAAAADTALFAGVSNYHFDGAITASGKIQGVPVNQTIITTAADLPAVVSGFHVWPSGTYRIDGSISSQYGHKRASGAMVYIYGKNLEADTLTFTGGEDGAFTSATDPGGGKTTIVTTDTGTIANGDIVFLPQTSVYDQEQRYTVSNLISNTSFDIDTAYISTDSGVFYKGAMFADDETASGQETALLRIDNVGIFISGGGRLLDFPDGGNTRGTLWFVGCFIVGDASNYCEMGTVHNFNFLSMTSIPICIQWDDGMSINDINQLIINTQMTAWKDNGGIMYKGGTGTFNLASFSGAGSIVQPAATEAVFYLDPAATYTNPIVIDGVVNTGTFFAAGSLDQTSINVSVTNVSGVPDSAITVQVDLGANTLDTLLPAVGAKVLIRSDAWTVTEAERITTDVTSGAGGVSQYIGLDTKKLRTNFSFSMAPTSAGTKALGTRLVKITAAERTVTFTNGTNIINETTTPRADGDTISFYDTPGTLPAELRTDVIYYIVNKAANTFQVSYTSGGVAVAFTDDGTPTNNYKVAILNGIPSTASISSTSPNSLTRFGILEMSTGDKFANVAWNDTDAVDISTSSGGQMV